MSMRPDGGHHEGTKSRIRRRRSIGPLLHQVHLADGQVLFDYELELGLCCRVGTWRVRLILCKGNGSGRQIEIHRQASESLRTDECKKQVTSITMTSKGGRLLLDVSSEEALRTRKKSIV